MSTSFSPLNPSFSGNSTSTPTITGVYTGTQDETFTFIAQDQGTVGTDNIKFGVYDSQNTTIAVFELDQNYQPNTPLAVKDGIKVAFSAGTVSTTPDKDQFSVNLSTSVPSSVNPDNPFNGTLNNGPNFDPSHSVTAGSFTVNGVVISVSASDSVNSVLDKITNSGAGVTATFDAVTEKVVLTQNMSGSQNSITVGNDTSGFLAATKLAGGSDSTFTAMRSTGTVYLDSFAPANPSFSGSSTSVPTISGSYTGSQDDVFTFIAQGAGTIASVGTDLIKFEVYNSQNSKITEVELGTNYQPGTAVAVIDGINVAFSAGTVSTNPSKDEFSVNVFAPSLSNGSFSVNGITINVSSSDSMSDVLNKISNSFAGVAASYDSGAEQIVLTQKTPGSSYQIILGTDTSGFLEEGKLTNAQQVLGIDDLNGGDQIPIAQVSSLSSINDGTFSINGVQISVDTATESLDDIINKINNSAANVTASLDLASGLLSVTSNNPQATLVLENGTSNFFSGVNITEGTFSPSTASSVHRVGAQWSRTLRSDFEQLGRSLNAFVRQNIHTGSPSANSLQAAIASTFESFSDRYSSNSRILDSGFGIRFDFIDPSRGGASSTPESF